MANQELDKNVKFDLDRIEREETLENKEKAKFFKWCEEEYGVSIAESDDIFEVFYHFSQDAKCHYETLIASYIILMDDMKSDMKASLQTFANESTENKLDKSELNLWREKAIENKGFIEKEIIAGKKMVKKIEEFISFCEKYEEIQPI